MNGSVDYVIVSFFVSFYTFLICFGKKKSIDDSALHLDLVQHSTVILLLSFAYRLYILNNALAMRRPAPSARIWLVCLAPLLLIATHTVRVPIPDELFLSNLCNYSDRNL